MLLPNFLISQSICLSISDQAITKGGNFAILSDSVFLTPPAEISLKKTTYLILTSWSGIHITKPKTEVNWA